ncbi:MAG: DUF2520 domain-containing protein [Bacillota bacterium]|nr:DUF2520 domain-containing protein [Bacillota bacterium]
MQTGFIGAGKVGCSLGRYLKESGVNIAGYYDRSEKAAEEGAQFTASAVYDDLKVMAEACDVLFITVPDRRIHAVYEELCTYSLDGKILCHCSGSISSQEAFPGARDRGACAYSVHPLLAVSDRFGSWQELVDAFFTLEGEEERIGEMEALLEKAGMRYQIIDPASKTLYHLAAVTASNHMLALISAAVEELVRCGFSEEDARSALTPLVTGNVRHGLEASLDRVLTGPVERGDVITLKKHLTQIDDPADRQLYMLLSGRLLKLAKRKNPDHDYTELEAFLNNV